MTGSIQHSAPLKMLEDVQEHETFRSHDGVELRNLNDLASHLMTMSDAAFTHHVSEGKNDFHSWVKNVHNDHHLAEKLHSSKSKHEMHHKVMGRIHELKSIHSKNQANAKLINMKHKIQEYMVGVVVGIFIGALISYL